jgi:hypothetical protein
MVGQASEALAKEAAPAEQPYLPSPRGRSEAPLREAEVKLTTPEPALLGGFHLTRALHLRLPFVYSCIGSGKHKA